MNKPIQVLFPVRVTEMVAGAAEAKGGLTSQYVRQAVYAALRADGFDPTGVPRSGIDKPGDLRQFALVDGGNILSIGPYEASAPSDGRQWLPVEYEDSQPFDPDRHYRLGPTARVDGDRVVRTYQVIAKGEAV